MVRNLLVLSILLGWASLCHAQVGKGFFAGAGLETQFNFSTGLGTSSRAYTGFGIGLPIRVGYYFSNRWSAGLTGSAGYSASNSLSRSRNLSGGAFVRYAQPIGMNGNLMLWGECYGTLSGYEFWTVQPNRRENLYTGTSINAGLSAGLLFFPSKRLGLEFGLGSLVSYNRTIRENNAALQGRNNFSFLNIGNTTPQLGVYYFFNR